jgi:hypothetical protein
MHRHWILHPVGESYVRNSFHFAGRRGLVPQGYRHGLMDPRRGNGSRLKLRAEISAFADGHVAFHHALRERGIAKCREPEQNRYHRRPARKNPHTLTPRQ